jgi:hypothetical protein
LTAIVHDYPLAHINNAAPVLSGYQTYATFHETSMEDNVIKSTHSMPMTLYFAICKYSCPEIVFSLLPKRPPDGLITAFIILMLIGSIFTIMTIRTCFNISIYLVRKFLVGEIKAAVWHTDRPLEPLTLHNYTNVIDAKTY